MVVRCCMFKCSVFSSVWFYLFIWCYPKRLESSWLVAEPCSRLGGKVCARCLILDILILYSWRNWWHVVHLSYTFYGPGSAQTNTCTDWLGGLVTWSNGNHLHSISLKPQSLLVNYIASNTVMGHSAHTSHSLSPSTVAVSAHLLPI